MSTQITLTVPNNIYRQAEYIAQTTNRPVTEVFTETILMAFPSLHVNEHREAMQDEVTAFQTMHADLWKQYAQQYVAVCQGAVVDHDVDELALVERVDEKYPDHIVLIRQVLPKLQKTLQFRSPHFVGKL